MLCIHQSREPTVLSSAVWHKKTVWAAQKKNEICPFCYDCDNSKFICHHKIKQNNGKLFSRDVLVFCIVWMGSRDVYYYYYSQL